MTNTDKVELLIKAGKVKLAQAELKRLIAAEPDNMRAQILFGTGCLLLGNVKKSAKVHDKIEAEMEARLKANPDSPDAVLWRKYHEKFESAVGSSMRSCMVYIVLAVILAACGVSFVLHVGNQIREQFSKMIQANPAHMCGPAHMTESTLTAKDGNANFDPNRVVAPEP